MVHGLLDCGLVMVMVVLDALELVCRSKCGGLSALSDSGGPLLTC